MLKSCLMLCLSASLVLIGPRDSLGIRPSGLEPPLKAVVQWRNGRVYLRTDRLEHAIKAFSKAISLHPGYAEAYSDRGTTHFRKGMNASACRDWEKACELNGSLCARIIHAAEKQLCQ